MFRFTIRDVLWLTVVVGMGCGWGVESVRNRVGWRETRLREAKLREELMAEKRRADRATKSNDFYERVIAGGVPFIRPKTGPIRPLP